METDMTETEAANLSVVRSYITAVESGATGDALACFFTPDATQIELPNRLNPHGGQSNLATILVRAEQGRKLLKSQRFEVQSETVQGAIVAIEAVWTGTLAIPLGTLAADATLRAHFAMFFELQDGRIRSQRNYDCFEPW
jgi:ketosteroid isomerase-like protein